MGAKFTKQQAERLTIIEHKVRTRPTREEVATKIELEKLQEKAFRAPCTCPTSLRGFKTIKVKPMSQNRAWQGKRFKSKEYKKYEPLVMSMLPKIVVPRGKLKITYEFGFSNSASDIDNPVKSCTDILQKKYGFNDKMVYEMVLRKVMVKKGQEYFAFMIESL